MSTSNSPKSKTADDLHALDRIDVGVHVANPHAHLLQVIGEIFRHPLGESRDEHPLAFPLAEANLVEEIVHLAAHRTHFDFRIDEAGRPNDLLDNRSFGEPQLGLTRRRGDVERARSQRKELVEHQRPVVQRARQAESVIDQRELARPVAVEHSADLRQRHVRLVDDDEEILGEIIEEARGPLAFSPSGKMPGVILDAGAGADLQHHLDVEVRP